MLIIVGGPKPLPEQVVLGCIRKLAKHESVRKSTVFLHEKHKTRQKYDKQQLIVRVVRQGQGRQLRPHVGSRVRSEALGAALFPGVEHDHSHLWTKGPSSLQKPDCGRKRTFPRVLG